MLERRLWRGWWELKGALSLPQPFVLPGRIRHSHRLLRETRSHVNAPTHPSHPGITSGQGDEMASVDPGAGRQLSPPCKIMTFSHGPQPCLI